MPPTPPHRESSSAMLRAVGDLAGPAGRLEALLNEASSYTGPSRAPYSALVCHPHPLGGGTMHNKVVYRAMKAFQAFGLPVLRFNFRGTGLSEGKHDNGRGEVDDVRAAVSWLDREFDRPILFCGFSFGAHAGLHACCGDARVKGMAVLGLPIRAQGRTYDYRFLAECAPPKLFVSGTEDEFGPRAEVEAVVARSIPPAQLVLVDGADHFFTGKLDRVQDALHNWIEAHFLPDEKE